MDELQAPYNRPSMEDVKGAIKSLERYLAYFKALPSKTDNQKGRIEVVVRSIACMRAALIWSLDSDKQEPDDIVNFLNNDLRPQEP